jgi:hypothetical protein
MNRQFLDFAIARGSVGAEKRLRIPEHWKFCLAREDFLKIILLEKFLRV